MKRLRFTIASFLIFILYCAVGFAALRSASPLWANGLFSLALTILMGATVGAVVQGGTERKAWIGFAMCGWAYFIASFGPWFNPEIRLHLISTTLLDELYPRLHNAPVPQVFRGAAILFFERDVSSVDAWYERMGDKYPPFQRIGHSIAAVLCAVIGGIWARLLATRHTLRDVNQNVNQGCQGETADRRTGSGQPEPLDQERQVELGVHGKRAQ